MAWVAFFALVLWLPVVYYLFEKYPLQKAIVFSFVTAWLFLPPTQIPLPGFPDWSKTTATSVSVSLCCFLKQSSRMLNFRPKWYDLPVIVYCGCPFISSVTNGLGPYDGLSAALEEVVRWGIPYLIGRIYLGDASGVRQLSMALAVGGMVYVPFCLYELRMSPQLKSQIYGFAGGRDVDMGYRYGGYRPMVFLTTGLELGWWMCCASLAAYMLWKSKSVKRIYGYPMAALTIGLSLVTVACKSTGALVQITVGVMLIHLSKLTKRAWLVWVIMAIPPVYCVVRPMGLWSGMQVVDFAAATFGADRAQSLGYRFEQEEILMKSANQRLLFGWGRTGGFNPPDEGGRSAVTDGFWIIVYGWQGGTGLASFNLMLLVPTGLFLRRFKPETWFDPEVAPATALAMILPLFLIDNLSNAMPNPLYALAMGAVAGYIPGRRGSRAAAGEAPAGIAQPYFVGLAGRGGRALPRDVSHDVAADEAELKAQEADAEDRYDEAYDLYQEAIRHRQAAVAARSNPARVDRLARTHVLIARFLTRIDQAGPAIVERDRALSLWRSTQGSGQLTAASRDTHAANLNDLAWLLVADEASNPDQVDRAIPLAEEAVSLTPGHAPFWNTLGIARYRHRDYYKAIHALSRSVSLGEGGGTAFDYYYLALANHALGYSKPAADWFDRAEGWAQRHPEFGPALDRARVEATVVFAGDLQP